MAFEFLKRVFQGDGTSKAVSCQDITASEMWNLSADIYIRELAFWACVNLMGRAISKCEFKTFESGKEHKGAVHYQWNYSPNKNQNSSEFLQKWIAQLYKNNEALVIEHDNQIFVADSFQHQEYALVDDIFTQVNVNGFTFRRSFSQSEVLHIKLSEKNMRGIVDGLYDTYRKLIEYGMRSYQKSRGTKGTLKIGTAPSGNTEKEEKENQLLNKQFRTFAEAENAVLTLKNGMEYTDIGSKTYSNEGTRDIRAMIDDVSDFTAKAFGIPPAILSGKVEGTAEAMDQFLTFGIDPLVKMLQQEITRKVYGFEGVIKGNFIQIDTRAIRHIDVMNAPAGIEKLVSSGVYCINDIRLLLGEPIINEPWAWKHFITKNFSSIQEVLRELKGGDSQ